MSMKILLHQILGVWDERNILKCTYISITLAILVEFLVISIFHENKIPTVDMKVLGYFDFRLKKFWKKMKSPVSMRNGRFHPLNCRGKAKKKRECSTPIFPKGLVHSLDFPKKKF
jgi:hypothetical protein